MDPGPPNIVAAMRDDKMVDIRTRLPLRSFRASVHARCVTFAVVAPTRRALAARRRRALGLGVGLVLAASSRVVAAAPEPAAASETPVDVFAPVDIPAPEPTVVPADVEPQEPATDEPATDEPEPGESEGAEPESQDAETETVESESEAPIRPPRFDGPYIGVLAIGTANFAKVIDLETPAPLLGAGGFLQAGDAVFPWMSIGIAAGGQAGWIGKQQMFQGSLLVEFGFVPVKRYPLSIRTGFGFGGGAVTEQGIDRRFGYGGALFKGSLRYEFFPLAETKRPDRGGGWAIGPELGWLGATPAGKGQPFVNTIILGLSTSFYFGS